MNTVKKNILVIGETGAGKSSLINLILGKNAALVSSSITTSDVFKINRFVYGNCVLHDVVDYNDAVETSQLKAFFNMLKFTWGFRDEGISLIIYTMKKGRITAASKKNYDYFAKTFCDGKVPVLLVVTHYEDESAQGNWFSSQQENFNRFEIAFDGKVCGCTIDLQSTMLDPQFTSSLAKKRDKTQVEVREKIVELVRRVPFIPSVWDNWILKLLIGTLLVGTGIAVVSFVSGILQRG